MYNFSSLKKKLEDIIQHSKKDIATLRTGKASLDMLDPVKVEAYGSKMAVNEVANIGVPDPNQIIIKPWDPNLLENIEQAIHKANLNLNPVVDGEQIRITVPSLTQERRQEMVKQLKQKIESAKVMVRNVRTDVKNEIDQMEGKSGVSEDDIRRDIDQLNQIIHDFTDQLEEIEEAKKQDLMEI